MKRYESDLTLTIQWECLGHGRFSLFGRANVANVGRLLADGREQFIGLDEITVDLEQADCCNTAGLALLLEWSTWGQLHGIKLIYEKPQDCLLKIVRTNDVAQMLAFSHQETCNLFRTTGN